MGGKSYAWFERQRRTRALELAQEQIERALDTVRLLDHAMQSLENENFKEMEQHIETLFQAEEEVDKLRREVFTEMSRGAALMADYREDILHLVKRLDTLADHVKDAARCLKILGTTELPKELVKAAVQMAGILVDCASTLRKSIESIATEPKKAVEYSVKVAEIEEKLDTEYLKAKRLFTIHGNKINIGVLIIFDSLIEFIEHAADMCADTADYILTLSSRE
ncbi:DUF47 family protein [Candidatus Bathyarchaeota archaeon]|nr:DUF47 family protein [Candidatus Bathyarchaeota archaeon]